MNTQFKVKFLNHLVSSKKDKGFTLIELLVVVIIIGVLAAIALPSLIGQVAKGRQAEAKNNLGALNRAQQAYRLEESTFTNVESNLPVKFTWQYYDPADVWGTDEDPVELTYSVSALSAYEDDILNYSAAVYQSSGVFGAVICEEGELNSTNPIPTPDADPAATDPCTNGKKVVK